MFQKIDLIAATRISSLSLLATLMVALSGCAGMQMGDYSERGRAVSGGYQGNETLAVLLPKSGRFASAAQVVRDGIVAAREADPQARRPELRFYDSTSGSVTALVQQAAADGASLVIGPLQKPAVEKLESAPSLPIPVLALNQAAVGVTPPHNLYRFPLLPEDEAADVAIKVRDRGHRVALVLYPEGNWGGRIARAFRQEWKALGGQMAGAQVYDPAAADFSDTVSQLSEHAAGADFVFLVATAKLARQIWPQIRHKIGTELPVYATSHIYSGHFDPENDRRLVGLNFVEIPWLIEPARGDAVSSKGLHKKLPRLYAMGVDAYRLGSRLDWMSRNPQVGVQGKTGILSMDSRRRIHRELTLARIDADGPFKMTALDSGSKRFLPRELTPSGVGPRIVAVGNPGLAIIER